MADQGDDLDAFRKKKGAKKSKAWIDFKDVEVGPKKTLKSICIAELNSRRPKQLQLLVY